MFAAPSAETPSDGEYNAVFQGRRMLSRLIEPKTSLELSAKIKGAPQTHLEALSPSKSAMLRAACVRVHRVVRRNHVTAPNSTGRIMAGVVPASSLRSCHVYDAACTFFS